MFCHFSEKLVLKFKIFFFTVTSSTISRHDFITWSVKSLELGLGMNVVTQQKHKLLLRELQNTMTLGFYQK